MKYFRFGAIVVYTILLSMVALIEGLFDRRGKFHSTIMRHWAKTLLYFSRIKLDVVGLENLKDANPALIIMNHESALDIPVAVASLPIDLRFIFKIELTRIPIFGWALWQGKHIAINRKKPKQAVRQINEKSKNIVDQGYNIIIAPEGTRNVDGKLLPFKKGGFKIAERFDLPIISLTMIGNRFCNPAKSSEVSSGNIKVVIEKAVKISQYENSVACIDDIRKKMMNHIEKYEPKIQEKFFA